MNTIIRIVVTIWVLAAVIALAVVTVPLVIQIIIAGVS